MFAQRFWDSVFIVNDITVNGTRVYCLKLTCSEDLIRSLNAHYLSPMEIQGSFYAPEDSWAVRGRVGLTPHVCLRLQAPTSAAFGEIFYYLVT